MVNLDHILREERERERTRRRQEKWDREEQKLDREHRALQNQNGVDPRKLNRNQKERLRHYAERMNMYLNPDHNDRRRAQRIVGELERRLGDNPHTKKPLMIGSDVDSSDDERPQNRRQPIARPRRRHNHQNEPVALAPREGHRHVQRLNAAEQAVAGYQRLL